MLCYFSSRGSVLLLQGKPSRCRTLKFLLQCFGRLRIQQGKNVQFSVAAAQSFEYVRWFQIRDNRWPCNSLRIRIPSWVRKVPHLFQLLKHKHVWRIPHSLKHEKTAIQNLNLIELKRFFFVESGQNIFFDCLDFLFAICVFCAVYAIARAKNSTKPTRNDANAIVHRVFCKFISNHSTSLSRHRNAFDCVLWVEVDDALLSHRFNIFALQLCSAYAKCNKMHFSNVSEYALECFDSTTAIGYHYHANATCSLTQTQAWVDIVIGAFVLFALEFVFFFSFFV